ncbi:hypothetical protein LCGC14_1153730 [marine sediment metagenome]|uniref:Uncharacterized protein n=1 Tax=marine sediment metagenome TaxID=412755 RepID=A0A0F9PCY3_9ZZZZ
MKNCKGNCGKHIGLMNDYCSECKDKLSLREKTIQAIKFDLRTY